MYRPSSGWSSPPGAPGGLDRVLGALEGSLVRGFREELGTEGVMEWSVRRAATGLLALAALGVWAAAAHAGSAWSPVGRPAAVHAGNAAEIRASRFKAFRLDAGARLATAPRIGLQARALAQGSGTVISVPAPDGTLQRFAVQESPVMEPGLAAKHPDITTY